MKMKKMLSFILSMITVLSFTLIACATEKIDTQISKKINIKVNAYVEIAL